MISNLIHQMKFENRNSVLKIIFICGSLEPGCDGVGDYTRRLAASLIKYNNQVSIISLNDRFIQKSLKQDQYCNGSRIEVLRVAASEPTKVRRLLIRDWIEDFNPDWLSLQFVLFSFHIKGLPFYLKKALSTVGKGRKWHIMFHEIWVGLEESATRKEIIWGWLQKKIIYSLLQALRPKVTHTQTKIYQANLHELKIKPSYLPLFSNIPKIKQRPREPSSKIYSFVLFGSIHPNAPVIEFADELGAYLQAQNVDVNFILVGRSGAEKTRWITALLEAGISVSDRGEQPESEISEILLNANVGITTNPLALAEKSGTVAAMLDHGLPVICVSKAWKQRHQKIDVTQSEGITEYKKGNIEACLSTGSLPLSKSIDDITSQLLDDLYCYKISEESLLLNETL